MNVQGDILAPVESPSPYGDKLPSRVGAPYQRHSETSREAAAAIAPKVGKLQASVLAYIKAHPRSTDAQIIAGMDRGANSIRPRRIELQGLGLIRQDGVVVQSNGRKAAVWVAA